MGKVKEPTVTYKPRKTSSGRASLIGYSASQLRAMPAGERKRILSEQAKHAAVMFAGKTDETIPDLSSPIEYEMHHPQL